MIAAKGAPVKRKPLNHTDYEVDLESRLVLASRVLINMNQDYFVQDYFVELFALRYARAHATPVQYFLRLGLRFILKKICNEKGGMKVDEGLIIDARNGDDSLISHATAEEKVKLEQQRCKEEKNEEKEAPTLNGTQCMGHDRGWEEAASAISRAFIGLNTCNVALLEAADESWEEAVVKMLTYRRVLPLG
ncbi:hypothetical protein Tco_1235219 [Tanacetum coccineum]